MSKPDIIPKTTVSGIAVDPRTLERVIPESRRPDGSIRKEIKIRPGYTPQEDVSRFRGSRQQQMDRNSLPKGHILGWVPPSSAQPAKPLSKSAKKNAKRKEKRDEKKAEETATKIKDSWEDDDEEEAPATSNAKTKEPKNTKERDAASDGTKTDDAVDALAEKVEKVNVR